jgi:uncharacterized protein with PIN domain
MLTPLVHLHSLAHALDCRCHQQGTPREFPGASGADDLRAPAVGAENKLATKWFRAGCHAAQAPHDSVGQVRASAASKAETGMRLLCDEMLKGVGRWLRAAGYDVAIVDDGAHDDDLLARAAAENRLLLTCDRRLAGRAASDARVIVLRTERFDSGARELRERLGIDWLHAPFTRCLLDNAPLIPADEERIDALPATVRQGDGPIMRCRKCDRVYWPGSRVRRMLATLTRARAEGPRN